MKMNLPKLLIFPAGLAAAIFGVIVMLLWNAFLPPLFGLPIINWLQATGLLILSLILFGGISGILGHSGGTSGRGRRNPFRDRWGATGGVIDNNTNICIYCGKCQQRCRHRAITVDKEHKSWEFNYEKCSFCGHCIEYCPVKSLKWLKA
jgi:Pyruvate/2-oxoacid:ferredoxin oxidoreductase delta subunit